MIKYPDDYTEMTYGDADGTYGAGAGETLAIIAGCVTGAWTVCMGTTIAIHRMVRGRWIWQAGPEPIVQQDPSREQDLVRWINEAQERQYKVTGDPDNFSELEVKQALKMQRQYVREPNPQPRRV